MSRRFWYNLPVTELELLHDQIRACRRCERDGFPISPPPLCWGRAPAPFLLVGQAPGISDWRGDRMYLGPAARKLIGWLCEAGFGPEDIGVTIYMTALTKCFPGRLPGKSTDRAPSPKERANCRPWLDAQWRLVRPQAVILFGKMAADTFLPRMPLEQAVGGVFDRGGVPHVPLPHSSGASTWLNDPAHRALLAQAIERLREQRARVLGGGATFPPAPCHRE
jgi:uracil-DNA glycosylase